MQLGHDGLQLDFQVPSIMSHLTDSSLLKLVVPVCSYEIGHRFSDTSDAPLKFKPIIVCWVLLFCLKKKVQWSTSMPWWRFQFMLADMLPHQLTSDPTKAERRRKTAYRITKCPRLLLTALFMRVLSISRCLQSPWAAHFLASVHI